MSSRPVVVARGVSKGYVIAHRDSRPSTVKEALSQFLRRGWARTPGSERFDALTDVSFDVQEGETLGIIGANGAGKSTLLKILSRIALPDAGTIELRGTVGSLLEVGTGFHPDLTGRENVYLNGAILGMTKREISRRFDEIVAFAEVDRFLDTPVKRYSNGMYVRLAFAVAAHLEPDILIVDEVLAVGDAAFQRKCLGKLDDVSTREGRTVLFVSHNQAAVETLCSRVLLMESGRLTYDGPTKEGLLRYLELLEVDPEAADGEWDLSRRENRHANDRKPLMRWLSTGTGSAPSANLTVGDMAEIIVVIDRLPDCGDPWLGVRLTTEVGQTLATFTTALPPGSCTDPRGTTVRLSLPELSLSPGRYRFDVGVVDVAVNKILDEARSAAVVSVRHASLDDSAYLTRFGDGYVTIPGSWTFTLGDRNRPGAVEASDLGGHVLRQ